MNLSHPGGVAHYVDIYQNALLNDVMPFWIRHGLDREHGGILTCLDRDGTVLDTDKSIWFQGRAGWMFAELYRTVERRPEWLDASRSCLEFQRKFGTGPTGKLYFTVTHDGRPLRMRRYAFSEAFASIVNATYAQVSGDDRATADALHYFDQYLKYSFDPAFAHPKVDPTTRTMLGIGPLMIAIVTAQELRTCLDNPTIQGKNCTEWIDWAIERIERYFLKPEHEALMETVGSDGSILDGFDGRTLNPGHALECAWFILREGQYQHNPTYLKLGLTILDWMWKRGWDDVYGGIYYFRDLKNLPVQEYWHDMKFWWPHCEAIIATLLAWQITGEPQYAKWHQQAHDWSFQHFADPEFGEWYGYLHRDGRLSNRLKGSLWKGPFHLPRMLLYGWKLLESPKLFSADSHGVCLY